MGAPAFLYPWVWLLIGTASTHRKGKVSNMFAAVYPGVHWDFVDGLEV